MALRYDADQDRAPVVVAQGSDHRADRICALAQEYGVVVRRDSALVEALAQLDEQTPIPVELYEAAAELLAFVYRLQRQVAGNR